VLVFSRDVVGRRAGTISSERPDAIDGAMVDVESGSLVEGRRRDPETKLLSTPVIYGTEDGPTGIGFTIRIADFDDLEARIGARVDAQRLIRPSVAMTAVSNGCVAACGRRAPIAGPRPDPRAARDR
jgi:hypothetical protein